MVSRRKLRADDAPPLDLISVEKAIAQAGYSRDDLVPRVEAVTQHEVTWKSVLELKRTLLDIGFVARDDAVERTILSWAFESYAERIASRPIHPSVKSLWEKERALTAAPRKRVQPPLAAGSWPFVAACMMATGRRLPAGPLDWELSGIPRSWFLKARRLDRFRFLSAVLQSGGFRDFFFTHVAIEPRNRALVLEKEVSRCYQRIFSSLAMQPEIKGVITASWFHDARAVRDSPHLEFLNRPYVEEGFLIPLEPATFDSGLFHRNPDREAKFRRGELQYSITLAALPRRNALRWLARQPESFDI